MKLMGLNKKLVKFLLHSFLLYGVWLLSYEFLLKSNGQPDHIITENISYFICLGLDYLGFYPHFSIAEKLGETFIFLNTSTFPLIRVGASCNGLELLILFSIFIICYPSNFKSKLWFIPIGCVLIHVVNIMRNFILTLMAEAKSPYFDLFHRYIFIFLVYGIIFMLWMWWAAKQSKLQATHEN
jgi:exosortase family protein XrtF